MKTIGLTQRVVIDPPHATRRDCLDQVWAKFLLACGMTPVPIPNSAAAAVSICPKLDGVVLTGGNDLAAYGGDAPERDETEMAILDLAEAGGFPVLGVCRGMQMIQHRYGSRLQRVQGHVAPRHRISIGGVTKEVNSFHNFGSLETHHPLVTWATGDDGVVEAVRHSSHKVAGIMWHPERMDPFAADDIELLSSFFAN